MQINRINFIGLAIFFLVSISGAHEKTWPEKRLRRAWPEAQNFTSKQVSLTGAQVASLKNEGIQVGAEDRSPIFYFVQEKPVPPSEKPKTIGVILFIDEFGANGRMEISVAMGVDGQVKKIDIWEHKENLLIAQEIFLKQFIGKSAKDVFVKNKDYTVIAEAEKASEAVAKSAKKALRISNIVFEKKN